MTTSDLGCAQLIRQPLYKQPNFLLIEEKLCAVFRRYLHQEHTSESYHAVEVVRYTGEPDLNFDISQDDVDDADCRAYG